MRNNRGYWGRKYKDVLSSAVVLSVISLMINITLIVFEDFIFRKESYVLYTFFGLLLALYLNVNYCANYYLLVKKYDFIGSVIKFSYGFIPCVTALVTAVFTVVK